MKTNLYMISFDGETAHWEDGGYTEVDTLFIVAQNELHARVIAADNAKHVWLEFDSEMQIIDLGTTDKPMGLCTDDWDILTPAHYELIFEADGIPYDDEPNALDALCFTADRDDTDDPRNWTGVR